MPEPTDPLQRKAMLEFWRFCFGWAADPDWEWLEAMYVQVKAKAEEVGEQDA
jgi:hypothetical protein